RWRFSSNAHASTRSRRKSLRPLRLCVLALKHPRSEFHLKRNPRQSALQDRRDVAERGALDVLPREDCVSVQHIEEVDLAAERFSSCSKCLLEVQVELVVTRVIERSRFVQDKGLGVGASPGEQAVCRLVGDRGGEARIALNG